MIMRNKKRYVFTKQIFPLFDMLKAKKLPNKVLNKIAKEKFYGINNEFHVNKIADSIHPKRIDVYVDEIIINDKETKTFILKPIDKKFRMPFFRAGQYVTISQEINKTLISRPYSISSSPLDSYNKNFISVTIKEVKNGFFSLHMLKKVKKGDKFTISQPEGVFYYDNLRDPKNIIAISGGSGITPFLSMAKAIIEGTDDFNLTILNGNRKKSNIIFYDELKEIEEKSNGKIKVINVLSEEKLKGFENGYINIDIIKKYIPKDELYSIWMCGPKEMYKFVLKEIIPLRLKRKFIRIEASNQVGTPKMYEEYINKGNKRTYKINVKFYDKDLTINADANDTILVSLQKAKISAQSKCLSGLCSWCRFKLNKGEVFTPKSYSNEKRKGDIKNNIYYSCCTFPISDIEIEAY